MDHHPSVQRADIIERLVNGALAGMEQVAKNANTAEVISACFTLTKRIIVTYKASSPGNLHALQEGVETLLLECVEDTKAN